MVANVGRDFINNDVVEYFNGGGAKMIIEILAAITICVVITVIVAHVIDSNNIKGDEDEDENEK